MPPPTAQDDLEGQTIAGCTFGRRLGRGRTGNVYEARYESIDKTVAVKILRGQEARQPELREAFLREARAIAALDHESIVKIFDVLETEDTVLIVMELLQGRNVWERLQDDGKLAPERAARIAVQVARALDAAHEQKLVHRDVKPQNVIVLPRDRVKVVDFGLAALPGTGGDRVGTPHYMAPEQVSRSRVDGAADVYSLGATLYHMLTGKTPYQGKTVGEILTAHKEGRLVPPAQVEPDVPVALDDLVRQMMAPAKGYRPDAAAVVKKLEEFLAERESRRRRSESRRPAAAVRRGGGGRRRGRAERPERAETARRPRRSPAGILVAVAVGVCVILVAILAILRMRGGEEETDPGRQVQEQPDYRKAPPPGPGPSDALDRKTKSEAAYRAVRDWAARNPGDKQGLIARLRQVATDWPRTAAARRAGKEAADLEMAREPERPVSPNGGRPPRRPDEPGVSLHELKARLQTVRNLTGKMLIAEADEAVKKLLEDAAGTKLRADAETERDALEWVAYLRQEMATAIETAGGVDYRKVKPLHPTEGALIVSLDDQGIQVKEGDSESTVAWKDLIPGEVMDLALACLPAKPKERFALGVFLVRAGLREKAQEEFYLVKMLSGRGGEYNQAIEKLGK
jgi:tRNA A-37 threonylcarbamoyl transferase component Bud32